MATVTEYINTGVVYMKKTEWVLCPVCGNKTRLQLRVDTELKNFPLYCPKCKQESLVDQKICRYSY